MTSASDQPHKAMASLLLPSCAFCLRHAGGDSLPHQPLPNLEGYPSQFMLPGTRPRAHQLHDGVDGPWAGTGGWGYRPSAPHLRGKREN